MRKTISKEALGEAPTCPWRAFYDVDVAEVLEAYELFDSGQLGVAIGDDPPAVLVDAIMHFRRAIESAKAAASDILQRQAEQKRKA